MYPILVTLSTPWGALPLYSYGVTLGLGCLLAWYLVMRRGVRRFGLRKPFLATGFFLSLVTVIVGARVGYVLTHMHQLDHPSHWFALHAGGLSLYGAVILGLLVSWLYCRTQHVPLRVWLDIIAPAVAWNVVLLSVGNWLYGSNFGVLLSDHAPRWLRLLGRFPQWPEATLHQPLWLGERLPHGSPVWAYHVETYGLSQDASHSLAVHPTQLYLSCWGLVLVVVTKSLRSKRYFRGHIFLTMGMLYGFARFTLGFWIDDPDRIMMMGWSLQQQFALLAALLSALVYSILAWQHRHHRDVSVPRQRLQTFAQVPSVPPPRSSVR